ncbi:MULTISPECIES: hypothetical protein [Pseudoalteromonas]|uniref:hypothetical protein n=1 Tax=Pseudoalteromonas TaxID=53246 RepID=UPI00078116A3|nr:MULTISPECIES: hypothetical protein [Pseudoalteromonas]MCO7208445.1 hypothetical protein [Pseudoalteromonas sp. CnMc7-37]MCZ4250242.1 hypothetical protein [Pseudoalteromonas shioyasakiensis]URQ85911.1 hypothetical protein J8Z28_15440 [Pseudoalteromonas sp. SCSIO 43088]
MKTLAIIILAMLLLCTDAVSFVSFDSWQLPLSIADMSWAGLEVIGAIVAVIAVVAGVALFTIGLLGAGVVALIGVLLAFLFGSVMIAWPLLLIAALCWLIADNKKSPA